MPKLHIKIIEDLLGLNNLLANLLGFVKAENEILYGRLVPLA